MKVVVPIYASDSLSTVYALLDPSSAHVRYIGQAKNLGRRYAEHIRKGNKSAVGIWADSLCEIGLKPLLLELETCVATKIAEAEIRWIADCRAAGFPLLNISRGGLGGDVYWKSNPSLMIETRRKARLSVALTGRTFSEVSRRKMSDSGRRKVFTPAHRAALVVGHLGKKHSEETKTKMSIAAKGNKRWLGKRHKPATIAKFCAHRHSAETLAKMRQSQRRRRACESLRAVAR